MYIYIYIYLYGISKIPSCKIIAKKKKIPRCQKHSGKILSNSMQIDARRKLNF